MESCWRLFQSISTVSRKKNVFCFWLWSLIQKIGEERGIWWSVNKGLRDMSTSDFIAANLSDWFLQEMNAANWSRWKESLSTLPCRRFSEQLLTMRSEKWVKADTAAPPVKLGWMESERKRGKWNFTWEAGRHFWWQGYGGVKFIQNQIKWGPQEAQWLCRTQTRLCRSTGRQVSLNW